MKKLILLVATAAVLSSGVAAALPPGAVKISVCPDGSAPECVEFLDVEFCWCSSSDQNRSLFDGPKIPSRINEGLTYPGGQDGRLITPNR